MPVVKRFGPYHFSWFPGEQYEPPHVHVWRDKNEAKYWLEPDVGLAKNKGFADHELTRIRKIIQESHSELVNRWYEHHDE